MKFSDLLTRVRRPAPAASERPVSAAASPAFWQAFLRQSAGSPPAVGEHRATVRASGATADGGPQETGRPRATAPRAGAETMPSVEPGDIARELALSRFASVRALQRLRRDFALKNHPDRVPTTLRRRATQRMMIANALIDAAMKRFGLAAAHEPRS